MTDWSRLHHAYGTAEDVPALLAAMTPDPADDTWGELWSRLYHQGSVYTASYAALPALTAAARRWPPTERRMPLFLAGSVIGSTDRPDDTADPHRSHAAEIAELHALTEESLHDPGLAADPGNYASLLGTLLHLEGVEVWGEQLDALQEEEYEVACPACETDNYVVFGEHGHFTTTDGFYMNRDTAPRHPLRPRDPAELTGLARRLHTRTTADGHPDLARKLTYVFGAADCADCGTGFEVAEAVVDRWRDC
ncbi:hypothetical protein [Kitasatospora sp. NPDC088134]|uniref:hypothetical protein n=1 Tax=Kitasatospora sp. NPDC088134 TaxID=3364071 RepID=UPI0037FD8186